MICGILSLKSKAKGNGADMCSKVIWKTDVFPKFIVAVVGQNYISKMVGHSGR